VSTPEPIVVSEVTVVLEPQEVGVTRLTTTLNLNAPGPQGPRGPAGPAGAAGGTVFEHTQSAPAGNWIVTHNLNRPVFVTVLNSAGEQILTDIDQSDPNTVSIVFATPTSGKVVLS
jgi:hypothetical protein